MAFNLYKGHYKNLMLIVVALWIVFLFVTFVYPGLTAGIDLKGGTMYIIRTDKPMDSTVLQKTLLDNFPLEDLEVATISSPSGHGATIQYANNKILATATGYIAEAKSLVTTDPAQAKVLARQTFDYLKQSGYFAGEYPADNVAPEVWVQEADIAVSSSEQNFETQMISKIKTTFGLTSAPYQKREIGATLGKQFWDSAIDVAITVLILITVIVFLFFREIVPSIAIISSAAFDILCALAFMAIFKIPLSLSTIPALLMLVGYSVDTDILLTTRILKRKDKNERERTMDAFWTGITMTGTAIAAVSSMLVISYFAQMILIQEIATVLLFGMIGDILGTWLMNAAILLWYAESKKKRSG